MRIDSRLALGLGLSHSTVNNIYDIGRSPGARLRIARLLRDVDELQTVPLGSMLTKDPDPFVRCEVALMLGSAGHLAIAHDRGKLALDAFKQLKLLASDTDWRVRHNVAFAVLRYGSEKALPIVQTLLQDEEPLVRTAALRAYVGLLALHPKAAAKLQDVQMRTLGSYRDTLSALEGRVQFSPIAETLVGGQVFTTTISDAGSPGLIAAMAVPRLRVGRSKLAEIFTSQFEEESLLRWPGRKRRPRKMKLSFGESQSEFDPAVEAKFYTVPDDAEDAGSSQPPPNSGDVSGPPGGGPTEEPKYITLPGPPRRYVNSWFINHPSPLDPLHYFQDYTLGIEVNPQLRIGTLTTGEPGFSEPDFGTAESLDVVVAIVTDDFDVLEKPAKLMRLPKDPSQKSEQVTFKVRPIKNHQDVFINVLFYRRNSLFQESIIGARVEVSQPLAATAPTSYFPARNKLHTTPLRGSGDVNLQIVKIGDRYRFVLFYDFGEGVFDIMWCTLPLNQERLVNLIQGMRNDLISVIKSKATLADGSQGLIFYDGEPAAMPIREERLPKLYPLDDATASSSLKILAEAGGNLFGNLFFSGLEPKEQNRAIQVGLKLRELSASRALKIQILSDEFFLPWNLIYDGEFAEGESLADRIWGFKHLIEELPGTRHDEGDVDDLMDVSNNSLSVGMNLNRMAIHTALIDPQLKELRSNGQAVELLERYSEQEVLSALQGKAEQARLEYFYCHAGVKGDIQQSFDQSYIGLTSADKGLTLKDIKLKAIGARFQSKPVVFLNACESSRMDGRFYDGFVPKFLMMGARAVVGSDCDIPSLLGAHFGTRFLNAFLQGDAIGEALLKLRKQFLTEYKNPLGLIYRVFGNADVRLSNSLIPNSGGSQL